MKWKAHFFLINNFQTKSHDAQEFYGFKTNVHPPHIKELDNFESNLIQHRKANNGIQHQIKSNNNEYWG